MKGYEASSVLEKIDMGQNWELIAADSSMCCYLPFLTHGKSRTEVLAFLFSVLFLNYISLSGFKDDVVLGTGEMAQQLRALTVLSED